MALAGASGGHVHVYLVSISVASTGDQKGYALANRVDVIQKHLTHAQREFPNIRKFKVCGEPLLIAIFDVPVEKMNKFEQVVGTFPTNIGVTITCEVLTNYERFAHGLFVGEENPDFWTMRLSDNYIAGLSPLIWCQYTLNFKGASVEVMKKAWKNKAMMFLKARCGNLVKTELFKVVGLPKMHAFVDMTPEDWDKFSFNHPAIMKDAGDVTGVIKMVTTF